MNLFYDYFLLTSTAISSRMLVFVYGTLKRGYSNHHWMRGATFVDNARTVERFALYAVTFPYLTRNSAIYNVCWIHGVISSISKHFNHQEDICWDDWLTFCEIQHDFEVILIQKWLWSSPFDIVDLDSCFFLSKAPLIQVQGELFEINDAILAKLDELEGYPGFYDREIIDVTDSSGNNRKAWVYTCDSPEGPLLPDGVYLE